MLVARKARENATLGNVEHTVAAAYAGRVYRELVRVKRDTAAGVGTARDLSR